MYCLMKCPGQFPRSPLFSSHQGPISNQQVNLIQRNHLTQILHLSSCTHICASYLFRYTLGIIFIIPVLRAYFVNLLDTQYLHQRSANDEHTFIFFFFFFPLCVCACGGSGQLTGHKSLMISSYEILNFLKMTCRPTQKVQYYKNGPEIVKLAWFSSCLTPLHINESYNSKEKSSTAFNCKFNLSQTFPTFFFAIKPNGPKFCCLKLIARVPA